MKKSIHLILIFLFAPFAGHNAAGKPSGQVYDQLVQKRLCECIDSIASSRNMTSQKPNIVGDI